MRGRAGPAAALTVVAVLACLLAACSYTSTGPPDVATVAGSTTDASCSVAPDSGGSSTGTVSGTIRVLAAASLSGAFGDAASAFEAAHPGTHVDLSFGPSSGLVAQVHQGAPADVLATADTVTMARAAKAGDVEAPLTFACNRLAILVAKGNPKHIASLADLARRDVRFVLCAAPVPCGRLARQALQRAGVTAEPVGSERDVTAVVTKVELGEVDAGIVYVTDAEAARGKAASVPIPASDNVVTAYPVAVVTHSANEGTAHAFVAYLRSPPGQAILARYGFTRS